MRAIITGGGTGGHVNPGLAIASAIKRNEPDSEIIFVGTKRGIENRLVPAAGYKLYHIDVRGIKRSLSPSNIKAFCLAVTSPIKAKGLIREFRPDVVVGTGGYVSWPVVKAATALGVPSALHESNSIAGVAVKMLQDKVDRIYLNFEETGETLHAKDKLMRVGNPLPGAFRSISREEARKTLGIADKYEKMILSYGGSLGAERVNESALRLMREYSSAHPEVYHVHAAGASGYESVKSEFCRMGLDKCQNIELRDYIYDMPVRMAAADVIICRAGAMTVSELAMAGKCPVFIPSPNVAENHQYKNARVLCDAGAGRLIEETELETEPDKLTEIVSGLIENDCERVKIEENIRRFAVKDTNRLIYNDLKMLVKKYGSRARL